MDVCKISFDARFKAAGFCRRAAETFDLSEPRHAGPHLVAVWINADEFCELSIVHECVGPGPNERHLTFDDVDQLGQLVKAGPAQNAAGPRHAVIAGRGLPDIRTVFDAPHRTELVDANFAEEAAAPGLSKEDSAGTFEFDCDGNQRPKRRADHEENAGKDDVLNALGNRRPTYESFFFTSRRPTGPRVETL